MAENPQQEPPMSEQDVAFDERVTTALNQSNVPVGLQQRLIANLETVSRTPEATATVKDQQVAQVRREFPWSALVAVAASLLLLVGAWAWIGRDASSQELAQFCRSHLDELQPSGDWQFEEQPQFFRAISLLNVRQDIQLDGHRQVDAGRFGKRCLVWRLSAPRSSEEILVFEFWDPADLTDVSGQLEMIHSDGSWSLAACMDDGRLIVVATKSNLQRMLRIPTA